MSLVVSLFSSTLIFIYLFFVFFVESTKQWSNQLCAELNSIWWNRICVRLFKEISPQITTQCVYDPLSQCVRYFFFLSRFLLIQFHRTKNDNSFYSSITFDPMQTRAQHFMKKQSKQKKYIQHGYTDTHKQNPMNARKIRLSSQFQWNKHNLNQP